MSVVRTAPDLSSLPYSSMTCPPANPSPTPQFLCEYSSRPDTPQPRSGPKSLFRNTLPKTVGGRGCHTLPYRSTPTQDSGPPIGWTGTNSSPSLERSAAHGPAYRPSRCHSTPADYAKAVRLEQGWPATASIACSVPPDRERPSAKQPASSERRREFETSQQYLGMTHG